MKKIILVLTLLPVLVSAETRQGSRTARHPGGGDMYDSTNLMAPGGPGGVSTPPVVYAPPPPPSPPPPPPEAGPACASTYIHWVRKNKCGNYTGNGSTGQVITLKNEKSNGYYGRYYARCTSSGWVQDAPFGDPEDSRRIYCESRYGDKG